MSTVKISISIPNRVLKATKKYAERTGKTFSGLVRQLLIKELEAENAASSDSTE